MGVTNSSLIDGFVIEYFYFHPCKLKTSFTNGDYKKAFIIHAYEWIRLHIENPFLYSCSSKILFSQNSLSSTSQNYMDDVTPNCQQTSNVND